MKKIFFSIFAITLLAFAATASAQMGMMGNYGQYGSNALTPTQSEKINEALQDIYNAQNIESQGQVDCSQVSDDQFDKLGDAYMGVMLPNEQQHEAMDNMMGGEGSASLRQAHINMGRSYLGCWSNYNSGPIYMPMMGGNGTGWNMMNGNYGYPSMMGGWGGYGFGGMIFSGLLWAFAIVGLVAIVKWLMESKKKE